MKKMTKKFSLTLAAMLALTALPLGALATTITHDGDASATNIPGDESVVITDKAEIKGDIDTADSTAVTVTGTAADLTMTGSITGNDTALYVDQGGKANVTGSLYGDETTIFMEEGQVTVTGNVKGEYSGVYMNGGKATVTGDVTVNDTDCYVIDNRGGIVIVRSGADRDSVVTGDVSMGDESDEAATMIDAKLYGDIYEGAGTTCVWKWYDATEPEEEEEEEEEARIYYIIRYSDDMLVENTNAMHGFDIAAAGVELTVTANPEAAGRFDAGTDIKGKKIGYALNADGTYTVFVPVGGGVDIRFIIEQLAKGAKADKSRKAHVWKLADDNSAGRIFINVDKKDVKRIKDADGSKLSADSYELTTVNGLTEIVFSDAYLASLADGAYTFSIRLTNKTNITFAITVEGGKIVE